MLQTSQQLFVIVSTGQNVANLPPVLEHAVPGDSVLWIESAEAAKRQWSRGAREVLQQRELRDLPPVQVPEVNEPGQVIEACRPVVDQWRNRGVRTFIVGNGGNKFTPIGLLQGLRELSPTVLYGVDAPAVCWSFPEGIERPPRIAPYVRHDLDLDDILAASGHVQLGRENAERFWPGPLPTNLAQERYGRDTKYTSQLHQEHFAWAAAQPSDAPLHFDDLQCAISPTQMAKWRASLRPLTSGGEETLRNEGILSAVYHATMNLAEHAALNRARKSLQAPSESLGRSLERAVARRVHAWLEQAQHPGVQSAWRNVSVAVRQQPDRPVAEFDVLLVLKSGVLWHLECKSATVDLKDMDARLLHLQLAGSRLARMALCVPIFTAFHTEPWFAALHRVRNHIARSGRMAVLPLNLPGQPDGYPWPDENGNTTACDCPTLERELEKCLAPFKPSAGVDNEKRAD